MFVNSFLRQYFNELFNIILNRLILILLFNFNLSVKNY